ncbi:hypothetical protein [Xanthomarina spongicola]|uniref:Uncharacterized protein n=1 Tax=Xanthomarina spongicola TaxID=570520 RepID=A0A316DFW4_9FLAO|nr:hypothetical protein [Xanthomarina spongicola]PWK17101.1 hypothetical protein LX78_02840 [Xanthomarina spongicola]
MDTSTIINTVGLIFDITGAILMFKNSMPVKFGSYLYSSKYLKLQKIKAKKMNRNIGLGALLLCIGFILQLVATFLG